LLYVISPALRKYVGPKTLSEFVGYRLPEVPFIDPQFKALEKEGEVVTLPPFMS
jgi:hypothetical protein